MSEISLKEMLATYRLLRSSLGLIKQFVEGETPTFGEYAMFWQNFNDLGEFRDMFAGDSGGISALIERLEAELGEQERGDA